MPQHPLKMTTAMAEKLFYIDIEDAPPLRGEARQVRDSVVATLPPLAAAPDAPIEPPPAPKPAPAPPSPPPQPAPPTPPPTTASQSAHDAAIARRRPRKVSASLTPLPPPVTLPVPPPTRH
jgi:hypothetical protein